MYIKCKGYGWLLFIVPLLLLIALRALAGDSEEANRTFLIGADLSISGIILFIVAAKLDHSVGIDVRTRNAWTTDLLESHHSCWNLPLRLVGIMLFLVGLLFLAV